MTHDARYWLPELETKPWTEVERWQAPRIEGFVRHLPERSPMYATLLEGKPAQVRDFAALADLPFTTKADVRAAQDTTSAEAPFGRNQGVATRDIVQTLSSSGTTGRPMYYALTAADVDRWSNAIAQAWYTAGLRADDLVGHLVALPGVAGGLPYADGFRRVGATLCWLGGFPTERILRELRNLRVSALLATTSFGTYLAEQWAALDASTGMPSSLSKVLCGGEPGLNQPEIRAKIRNGLGIAALREVMGLGDVLSCLWSECEAEDGMHFNAQASVAVELIDPETGARVPWTDGAKGELVYTTFERDATPMLRYRSRDHAHVTGTSCACGRTSPRIRCIGRTDDMLIYKGMNLFPTAVRDLVAQRFAGQVEPLIRIWKERADQVRFDDAVAVDVEASASTSAADYPRLAESIATVVRTELQVRIAPTVVAPGTLPRGTYKTSLVAVREAGKAP
ncbi:MAG TPA: AMP-binding protein [Nevskiaceae bacterium]|nr:AMP-binding protein [Nevskiaceae bacterium]